MNFRRPPSTEHTNIFCFANNAANALGGEEETEPVTEDTPVVDIEITPGGLCAQRATPVSSIQGSGTDTPLAGNTVIVKGVVTAVFPRLSG